MSARHRAGGAAAPSPARRARSWHFAARPVTHFGEVVTDADLPFLEVICQHVSRSMEMTALYATLEQRVERAHRRAPGSPTQQLAESLERLQSTQHQLVEASRRAGMSDVATSVLHNVGNVLNSVNVSATLVEERVAAFKAKRIGQVAELIAQPPRRSRELLHPRSARQAVARVPRPARPRDRSDQEHVVDELVSLRRNVDHIKAIVALQQDFAKTLDRRRRAAVGRRADRGCRPVRRGVLRAPRGEPRAPASSRRAPIVSDRHKILQILTNLLSNARHAVSARPADRRR